MLGRHDSSRLSNSMAVSSLNYRSTSATSLKVQTIQSGFHSSPSRCGTLPLLKGAERPNTCSKSWWTAERMTISLGIDSFVSGRFRRVKSAKRIPK